MTNYDDDLSRRKPRKQRYIILGQPRTKIGNRLLGLRMKHKFSQEDAANGCDITQSLWGKIEAGYTKDPTMKTLIKIATAFGITLDDLTGRTVIPIRKMRREAVSPLPFFEEVQ